MMLRASLLIALLLPAAVQAAKVYKWVDADGVVHYGNQPPPGGAQTLDLRVPKPSAPPPAPAAGDKPRAAPAAAEKAAAEEDAARAARERERAEKNCLAARKRLRVLEQGGRIYELDDKGERRYLSDEEIARRAQEAQALVEKWCAAL